MSNAAPDKGPRFPTDATEIERVRWCNAISNMRVLANASDETLKRCLAAICFRRHESQQVIVSATEPAKSIFFLVEGVVRAFQEEDGVQYTAKLLTAPTHFGEIALLAGFDTYRSSIAALAPAVTAEMSLALLEAFLADDPKLTRAWLYSVARQFSVTIDFLKQTVFGGVAARLANVLLSYGRAFGQAHEDDWIMIDYQLSYADLGREAACTRRAVIIAMQTFAEQGVVKRHGAHWAIRPAQLEACLLPGRLSLTHALTDNRDPEVPDDFGE
jgi:CRP-like cAMP-binding protein